MSRCLDSPAWLIANEGWIDLGDNHAYKFFSWNPDRELNPQYDAIADIPRMGASVVHLTRKGEPCQSAIHFDLPAVHQLEEHTKRWCAAKGIAYGKYPTWAVQSFEPLSVTPSLLCTIGKAAAAITDSSPKAKWVRA